MAKKYVPLRLDEHLLEAILGVEQNASSRTEAIENRLRASMRGRRKRSRM